MDRTFLKLRWPVFPANAPISPNAVDALPPPTVKTVTIVGAPVFLADLYRRQTKDQRSSRCIFDCIVLIAREERLTR